MLKMSLIQVDINTQERAQRASVAYSHVARKRHVHMAQLFALGCGVDMRR